jgi:hypothetical protein
MQTTGALLLMIERCSLARTWMLAQGSRSAYGLPYLAAVRGDWREHEDRRHRFANTLSKPASLSLVKVTPSATRQTYWRYGTLTGCWNGASRW